MNRHDALLLGTTIRAICAIDALANNNMTFISREMVREACDMAMDDLGYETITQKEKRLYEIWNGPNLPTKKDLKFRKIAIDGGK